MFFLRGGSKSRVMQVRAPGKGRKRLAFQCCWNIKGKPWPHSQRRGVLTQTASEEDGGNEDGHILGLFTILVKTFSARYKTLKTKKKKKKEKEA